MIDYLTAPDVPITEASVTYERLWVERAVAEAFAICGTCPALSLENPHEPVVRSLRHTDR